jgi:hypothetical protein
MGDRRVVYDEARVRLIFGRMKQELDELRARYIAETAHLRRELDQVRAAFNELRAVSAARQRGQAEVAELHRRRDLLRAFGATRDPTAPLN